VTGVAAPAWCSDAGNAGQRSDVSTCQTPETGDGDRRPEALVGVADSQCVESFEIPVYMFR
jgi:hypothetical protein